MLTGNIYFFTYLLFTLSCSRVDQRGFFAWEQMPAEGGSQLPDRRAAGYGRPISGMACHTVRLGWLQKGTKIIVPLRCWGRYFSSYLWIANSNANNFLENTARCSSRRRDVSLLSLNFFVVPRRVVVWGRVVSVEVFPQTQGGVELWSGLLLLHTRLVPHRLRRPAATPSTWSVCSVIYVLYVLLNFLSPLNCSDIPCLKLYVEKFLSICQLWTSTCILLFPLIPITAVD